MEVCFCYSSSWSQFTIFLFLLQMLKNSLAGSKKKQLKGDGSRSRSISPQGSKNKLKAKGNKRLPPKSSRDLPKNRSPQNPSIVKNSSKRSLNKSLSQKKLNRSSSQPRIKSSKNLPKKNLKPQGQGKERPRDRSRSKQKTKQSKPLSLQQPPMNSVKSDQREMGLIFIRPQHDKIMFKGLQITEPVFDKYLDMINNDNDANYVMNALPELNTYKKQDETEGRDFVSGRISRLSGVFENLSVDKIITPARKTPQYYSGQCGKNLTLLRIMLQTKFKVQVDLGFLQYSLDGDKLTIFRIYISKIYRRMNYALKALMSKHPGADRWSIFILEKNANVHKFFKYLGFHIEKIASQSKNKIVDYFQEFSIKKKQLNTVIASMTK